MVAKSFKQQIHKDQSEYVARVNNAGGAISSDAQKAIARFIKFHYANGLRDNAGLNHLIQHCCIYPTNNKNGSDHNLWYLDGKTTHYKPTSDPNYSYTLQKGAYLTNQLKIDTDVLSSLFSTVNFSMGFFLTLMYEGTGEIGGLSDGATKRLYTHPQYTGTRGVYFDCGNSSTTGGRTFGAVPGSTKNNKGLTVCSKFNNTGKIQVRDTLITTNSTLATNLPTPGGYQEINPGYNNYEYLSLGGYWWGKAIDESLFTNLANEWNILQSAIHPNRNLTFDDPMLAPTEFTGLALWFDATDASTVIRDAGTQNVTRWNDKSGNAKHASAAAGNSVPYTNGNTINKGSLNVNFKSTSGFYFGCIAVVFTPGASVNYNSGGNNNTTLLGTENAQNYSGIKLGATTSFLTNEVATYLYASNDRVGYTSTGFSFNANQRYLLIINRRSGNDIDIYINANKVASTYNLSPPQVTNKEFSIGSSYLGDTTYFNGGYHEIVNYQSGLSSTDVEKLKNYLVSKWSIS